MALIAYRVRRGWRDLIRPWIGAIAVLAIAGGAVLFALLGPLVAVTVVLSLLLASGAGVQVRRTARSYRFGA